ncbi:hypothetical protein PISMIDRAFT_9512 [Pisolithus microcarpus 441]|uniref:Uncharacterized protein n=1 Tax=Pisolithus microcarpus 441 TaxID=765257 RepID=A0A0C9Z822_9AGAM|nr:hypothetical protein BKA83DRAFT_9512 [Pisolithus microcarpus]KIK25476.1 hypothetical protein PISMIDRAFT_9512 [Pisolithus microcarpus 441]
MQAQASAILEWPTGGQYDCICIKYGFGCIHKVSHSTWLQHLANVSLEEECQRIRSARLLGERITSLPPLANSSPPPNCNLSVPPSIRRIEALWGLAKWARENCDPNKHVGRRKRARLKQPTDINQNEDSSRIQMDANKTAGHVLSQPAHPGDGAMDVNDPQGSDQSNRQQLLTSTFPVPITSARRDRPMLATTTTPSPLTSYVRRDRQSAKGGGKAKMRPGPAKNGHNLCAHCWRKQVQSNGSTEEFQKYYTGLTSAQRQAYDDEAAALYTAHIRTESLWAFHQRRPEDIIEFIQSEYEEMVREGRVDLEDEEIQIHRSSVRTHINVPGFLHILVQMVSEDIPRVVYAAWLEAAKNIAKVIFQQYSADEQTD